MIKARILPKEEYPLWNKWIFQHPLAEIQQCSIWGDFQEKIPTRGKRWIVTLEENGKIIGGSQFILHKLPRNLSWLYAARGPLLNYERSDIQHQINLLTNTIKQATKADNVIFLRIDPPFTMDEKFPKIKGFHKTTAGYHPEHTLILDLAPPEPEILAQMKPKGRYNIRLAEKKGVNIRKSDPINNRDQFLSDIDSYHKILKQTTERDGFHGHRKGFYQTMLETLYPENLADLFIAEYEGRTIAAIIVTYFKDTALYYYGVSSNEDRNVMAPYLLQWEAIKDSKNRGIKYYDFLGVAPQNQPNHPWRGVTSFKEKFGGLFTSFHPAQEKPLKFFWYWLYRLHKKLKKTA